MSPMPKLEDVITSVRAETVGGDPLARLTKASEYASGLASLGDLVLDHFVNECREAGLSWAELSSALGVSKQAAHKRFTGSGAMFQRFTDRARKIVSGAEAQSRELGYAKVEPEHFLLALAKAEGGIAVEALTRLNVTYDQILEQVLADTPRIADPELPAKIPFTERSKSLLQFTLEEALGLGHNYIGTEHLLLALHRDESWPASRYLTDLGATSEALRHEVEDLLAEYMRQKERQT